MGGGTPQRKFRGGRFFAAGGRIYFRIIFFGRASEPAVLQVVTPGVLERLDPVERHAVGAVEGVGKRAAFTEVAAEAEETATTAKMRAIPATNVINLTVFIYN